VPTPSTARVGLVGPFAIEARRERPGRFVSYGHIYSHEDHETIRPFVVRGA